MCSCSQTANRIKYIVKSPNAPAHKTFPTTTNTDVHIQSHRIVMRTSEPFACFCELEREREERNKLLRWWIRHYIQHNRLLFFPFAVVVVVDNAVMHNVPNNLKRPQPMKHVPIRTYTVEWMLCVSIVQLNVIWQKKQNWSQSPNENRMHLLSVWL